MHVVNYMLPVFDPVGPPTLINGTSLLPHWSHEGSRSGLGGHCKRINISSIHEDVRLNHLQQSITIHFVIYFISASGLH